METHNIITDDSVEEILSRVPVRHLLRFRCVSKSWCALIDSTSFINKHHQIQSTISREEGGAPLFLTSNVSEFHLLSKKPGDNILCLTSDLDRDRVPNDDPNHFNGLRCMGVVNGVVGLCWGDNCLGLWNPATRDFKVVPPPRPSDSDTSFEFGVDILGLGFDPRSSDFKIVRSVYWNLNVEEEDFDDIDFICEMYSLTTNSWMRLELPLPLPSVNFPRTDGYCNGVCYWIATEFDGDDDVPQRNVILSFDFSTEAFKSFDAPTSVVNAAENNVYYFDWMVGLYMERLALIFGRQNSREALLSFEIWVASEFDVVGGSEVSLSWQHLFTVEPPKDCIYAKKFVAFRMDGNVLFSGRQRCNLYNPSTRTFENLGFPFHSGYSYVESLFPLSNRRIQSYKLKNRKRKPVLETFENKCAR